MKKYAITVLIVVFFVSVPALAGNKLNSALTPMGAEIAGNKDGSIPAWTGGIMTPPVAYKKGGFRPDPFSDDKPLFIITSKDWTQYKDKLSNGHQAMFQKYLDYRMPVYPARRSASYPDFVYEAVKQNAGTSELAHDGNAIKGGSVAVPFPVPTSGLEAIWNHLLRYRGQTLERTVDEVAVTSPDHFVSTIMRESILFPDSFPGTTFDSPANILVYLKQNLFSPPRSAGTLVLVAETLDKVKEKRRSWLYNPGQRRVSRMPFLNYDTLSPASEGLRTIDQYDLFNGATDRYEWTLQGKEEMYVPYNAYRFADRRVKKSDVLRPYFLNPDYTRYELHRVWKVSAVLKKGENHIYARRIFYIDEDSWQILVSEEYDGRGDLWRFSEGHAVNFYDVPLVIPSVEMHYDLKSGQYVAMELQVDPINFSIHLTADDFTPAELRREGNR